MLFDLKIFGKQAQFLVALMLFDLKIFGKEAQFLVALLKLLKPILCQH